MGWPIDPTGGYGRRAAEELMRRNRQNAGGMIREGIKTTARNIKANPRVVQEVMRTGGQQAVRTAGLSVGETTVATGVGEAGATGAGATASEVMFGLTAGELLIVLAVILFVAYLVYSWSQMDPKMRGYSNNFEGSPAQQELAAMGEEGPVGGLQRVFRRQGAPVWMKNLAAQV